MKPAENPFYRSRRTILVAFATLLIIFCIAILLRRQKKEKVDPEFSKYITSYTTGVVSRAGTIQVRLADAIPTSHAQNEEVKGIFEFSPSVEGKAYWVDAQTIEFRPSGNLEPGKAYSAEFHLGEVAKVPGDFSEFRFDFETIRPDFTVSLNGLQSLTSASLDQMKMTGVLQTADVEDPRSVEKLVQASFASPVNISWQHHPATKSHEFTISKLVKAERSSSTLEVKWDGGPLGIDKQGEERFEVPQKGVFKVLAIRAVHDDEEYAVVQFSNPVAVGQDLSGLFSLNPRDGEQKAEEPVYTIDGSQVKIYGSERLEGNYTAAVNRGVEDIGGKKINRGYSANLFFENRLPAVSIPGKGVILPGSKRLTLAFEAVNLNAVDVSIIKIYENNVPSYFQDNNFDGEDRLRQVGKPVVQTTLRLDSDKGLNLSRKNRFMLDIDHLLRTEPGAIYRVIIGFRKSYSIYGCGAVTDTTKVARENNDEGDGEYSGYYDRRINDEDEEFWSRYDNYYPDGFNWDEREDPCSLSFYNRERWATRNIIASNIGLIAKRGNDNSMVVAVTDILEAGPMADVQLELLDYQKQVISTVISDADGLAKFSLKRKPYLIVAKKGSERGYLKLDDGNSLPLSRFDVGGETVQNGLKGFLYGERGVWRPGDSIFLSFILEDKQKQLPPDHPVLLELYNPSGQLYRRLVQTQSVGGFYSFRTATATASPTGNWVAKVKVGGATYEKTIKVETIMPNRLKLDLSFGNRKELTKGTGSSGLLKARWLFGGAAQNLKASVTAFLSSQTTAFPGFEGYTFDDPTLQFATQTQSVFEGNLDANGTVRIDADINPKVQAPGQLRANFLVKVFEPGGNFSVQQVLMPYNIFSGYVGINPPAGSALSGMLTTNKDHVIDLADVDAGGHLINGVRTVDVELYKIQWRWWWDQSGDEVSNFTQNEYNKLVRSQKVQLVNGRGKWTLRIGNEGWGRYLLKVKDPVTGHATGKIVYIDWSNWAERLQQDNPTDAAMLSFTSDKKTYKVGEKATLTIPTAADGRALISFENGSKVLKTEWIDTQKGQTIHTFTVDEEMAPNIFVNVTMLQRHAQTVNDLPIRMYGAIPIQVENPATILKPVISMPSQIRPETSSSITVSEASGKEMTYTIAIVDEGILDLTNFKTPDPHRAFYAREALGVKTWDLFDYVIGAYGGGLERILSIGGDQALNVNKNTEVNRFKPVVKFLGPFKLGAGEKQTKNFTLPQYVGSVRAMVVAGGQGGYGFAEKAVAVKKPLMLLATIPRVLGPGESFQLPVTVFAMDPSIKTVTVELQSAAFQSSAAKKQVLRFAKTGDQLVTFNVDVKNTIGVGKVRLIARSGNETAVSDVELAIRNPNPPITHVLEKELAPGAAWQVGYATIGLPGTTRAMLEVSSIPALNLAKRLTYLLEYPHGCIEQTTSSVFPQLYLGGLVDLSAREKAMAERNIKSGINRIAGFQTNRGGFSYWPGEGEADDWGTNYGGHFLLEAQAQGYLLPAGLISSWKKFQRQKALNWAPDTRSFYGADLVQAYRLYLLALAQAPEIGAMNRLKEFPYLSVEAKWRLAAAYKLAGQPETGLQMISKLPRKIKPYKQLSGTYGSDLRDEAMILETLTLFGQQGAASSKVREIAAKLSQDEWYSTQTTAYSLLAIARYCSTNASGNKLVFDYRAGTTGGKQNSGAYLWRAELPGKSNLAISNKGYNRLYVRLITQGQPPPGQEPVASNNAETLDMTVGYFTLGGKPVDISAMRQGTDFVAQVKIRNPGQRGKYQNMALSQIFPSGWEILNTRMLNNDEVFKSAPSDYRDYRDDRVNTYFSIGEGEEVTYYVMLNAAYTGKFYLPATYCEAMYDASISAIEKGRWVTITR